MKKINITFLLIIFNSVLFAQWSKITPDDPGRILGAYFINNNIGYFNTYKTTYKYPFVRFFKTIDKGNSWQEFNQTKLYQEFYFFGIDSVCGIHPGNNRFYCYLNSIEPTDSEQFANNSRLYFNDKDKKTLFVWEEDTLLKSTDYGKTWKKVLTGYVDDLHFISKNMGFCFWSGDTKNGFMKTTDNGETWVKAGEVQDFYKFSFITENTGFGYKDSLWKTTDGGKSWKPIMNGLDDLFYGGYIFDVKFANENTGYLLMFFAGNSVVYKTVDGGGYWHLMQHFMAVQMDHFQVIDENNVFLYSIFRAGYTGIYRTTNGGGLIGIEENEETTTGYSILPNPANTTISITGTKDGNTGAKLYLFDLQGKLLLSENLSPGKNNINISGFEKGIYLLRIRDREGVWVRKVVKE